MRKLSLAALLVLPAALTGCNSREGFTEDQRAAMEHTLKTPVGQHIYIYMAEITLVEVGPDDSCRFTLRKEGSKENEYVESDIVSPRECQNFQPGEKVLVRDLMVVNGYNLRIRAKSRVEVKKIRN